MYWFLYVYSEQLLVHYMALGIIHVANGARRFKNTYVSVRWKLVSTQQFPVITLCRYFYL